MKKLRLDLILHRLGYVSEEHINRALIHQKQHGRKLGSNLLQMKYITEEQLTEALSVQYDVPGYFPPAYGNKPPEKILKKLPAEFAEENLVIPLQFDTAGTTLSIVIADPEDGKTIAEVGRICNCESISVSVAPESVIERLIAEWYRGRPGRPGSIELPELFSAEAGEDTGTAHGIEAGDDERDRTRRVLMVSDVVFLRNFLTPIFEREGCSLTMLSEEHDVISALRDESVDHVLVSQEMSDAFEAWIHREQNRELTPEISVFSTISEALLDNPVPYSICVSTVIKALQIVAEGRSSSCDPSPPYNLICRDVQALSRAVGLNRLAVDGLQMAALLLVPADRGGSASAAEGLGTGMSLFTDTDRSIEYARSLRFPWDIEGALRAAFELVSGRRRPADNDASDKEVALGAQLLALVWHRHMSIRSADLKRGNTMSAVKTGLRKTAGLIARSDVIETYIRHIEQGNDSLQSGSYQQLFIVGEAGTVVDQFAARLKGLGYHLVRIYDLEEARRMSERLSPTGAIVDVNSYPGDILGCREMFSHEPPILLFAVTADGNPSHILDLFDAGFDEVFTPPFDFDVITARIGKTIRGRSTAAARTVKPGGFSAEFKALSFTDLIQALGQSLKSVRIRLARNDREQAEIYMNRGRPVFAKCGDLTGVEAVYRVIGWQEDGAFVVEPEDVFPRANIDASVQSILMEGCRQFDEKNA
jgi:DNA-binding response OmpR family regulator